MANELKVTIRADQHINEFTANTDVTKTAHPYHVGSMSLDDLIAKIDATIATWRDAQQGVSMVGGHVNSTVQRFAALGNAGIARILNDAADECDGARQQIEVTIRCLNEARSLVVQAKNSQGGDGGASNTSTAPVSASAPKPAESGYPHHKQHPMSWSDLLHVVHGDPNNPRSGGHLSGTNRPGKTEFPPDWDDVDIHDALVGVANDPTKTARKPRGNWFATGMHRGVTVQAVVRQDGSVEAGWPLEGPGVKRNPS